MELLGQNEIDHHQRQVAILSQDSFYRVLTPEQKAKALKGQFNFDHPGMSALVTNTPRHFNVPSGSRVIKNGSLLVLKQQSVSFWVDCLFRGDPSMWFRHLVSRCGDISLVLPALPFSLSFPYSFLFFYRCI